MEVVPRRPESAVLAVAERAAKECLRDPALNAAGTAMDAANEAYTKAVDESVKVIEARIGKLVSMGLSANEAMVMANIEAGETVTYIASEQGVSQQSVSDALRRAKIKMARGV